MVRVVTKVGDVFSVKLDNEVKKYFQLIAFDLTQLNSDVIRAFKKVYRSTQLLSYWISLMMMSIFMRIASLSLA